MEYPLGPLRPSAGTEPASPIRLIDLDFSFRDENRGLSGLTTRFKLGELVFIGLEVDHDRRGVFLDTARSEFGITDSDDGFVVEGAYRLKRLRQRVTFRRFDASSDSQLELDGGLRLTPDVEVSYGYFEDFDDRENQAPSLETFIQTGRLPPAGDATRLIQRSRLGLLYQRGSRFDLGGRLVLSRHRAEGGFDFDRLELGVDSVWSHDRSQLAGDFGLSSVSGRLARRELVANLRFDYRLLDRLVVHGATVQQWQPGISRFRRGLSGGATWFARRHQFARSGEIGARLASLTNAAFASGYSERRGYDARSLRAIRERLSIAARPELISEVNALYRAQVRSRLVPQLGAWIAVESDRLTGIERRSYHLFIGVPWRFKLAGSDRAVNFIQLEWRLLEQRFEAGIVARGDEISVRVALNRELEVRVGWNRPGRTPIDIARRLNRPESWTVDFIYALGR